MSQTITEISPEALDALIKRVSEAKQHNLALSPEDCQLLLDALLTLASLQERIGSKNVTIHKLRKLVGMVQSSERLSTVLGQTRPKKHQRSPKAKPSREKSNIKPKVINHSLTEQRKGDACPKCNLGKLYKYQPATLLRISGQSPYLPEQHVMERLRCNACGAYFTATLPEDVLNDGEPQQKYGYSARSLMGISKYYGGMPFYRQGRVQDLLGVSISASTIFDQNEYLTNAIYPVFKQLRQLGGNGKHYYQDDTTNRILDKKPELRKARNSNKETLRTGVYTSGLIVTTECGHDIVLFNTGIGHAGEFIDELFKHRDPAKPPPLIMSDALASNRPSRVDSLSALCNSHGRRQFYDIYEQFPDEVEHVLMRYQQIWAFDDETEKLSEQERLAYHQQHSLPIMEEIKGWCSEHLSNETVEENSALGKAMNYFLKHYQGLSTFCRVKGAKLDNNRIEAKLKLVVRNRKNAMFHKTQTGADIGDVITSLIATAEEAGINVFDYFNLLQQEHDAVASTPEKYLPWNYQKSQA